MSDPTERERRPSGREWVELRDPAKARRPVAGAVSWSTWSDGRILVMTALELAEAPDQRGDSILQWHISFSRGAGKRAKPHEARRVLRAFGMVGAEEDNHEPGAARHFWMPLDPSRRVDCACKTDETVIVEPDGHRWSCTDDPTTCGGCRFEQMLRDNRLDPHPCPRHRAIPSIANAGDLT